MDPGARVWRGSEVPTDQQGIKVLGTLVGHDDYVRQLLEKVQAKQQVLLDAIPKVPDVQSAWLLLLHCASARAIYQLRVDRPGLVESFAESHDQGLWRCLCAILEVPVDTCDVVTRATATLLLSLGCLGLRSAERTKVAACWASWADALPMIHARHPTVAALMVQWSPSMEAASWAATQLEGMASFAVPQQSDLAGGLRSEQREGVVSAPAHELQRTSSRQVTEWTWSRCGTVDKPIVPAHQD